MKKMLIVITFFGLMLVSVNAQDVVITGNITSDLTLTANNTYLLKGLVRVQSGATLTIQAGTKIYGANDGSPDPASALIVKPGGKIIADGTELNPIIFTSEFNRTGSSRLPTYGDWGGVIILGNAPINVPGGTAIIEGPGDSFGGTNPDDNSGILRYVRIEYTGFAYSLNNEINGLTMGGVGRGTTLEHIQVSFCGDDSFEWFGGNVNAKYLISYRAWDDDFDTDFGYTGKLQFLLGVRDPQIADQSTSNGFESDNDGSGSDNTPLTSPTWWNVTLIGPKANSGTVINSLYGRGMHLRRNSQNKISNAIIMGWPRGVRLDGNKTVAGAQNGTMWINNAIIAGWTSGAIETVNADQVVGFDVNTWYSNSGGRTYPTNDEVMLTDPFNLDNPNVTPLPGSPALTGGATPPNDGFFDVTATTPGALSDDPTENWTANWTTYPSGLVGVEDNATQIVTDYRLEQNYPNPFNPSTVIDFKLPEAAQVKLSVYNVLGQEVAVLVDEFVSAGSYSKTFNAKNLTSGLYIYTFEAGSTKISKKMTLLK
jgi:hypothetical protein